MVVWLCSGGILGLTWVSGVKNDSGEVSDAQMDWNLLSYHVVAGQYQ